MRGLSCSGTVAPAFPRLRFPSGGLHPLPWSWRCSWASPPSVYTTAQLFCSQPLSAGAPLPACPAQWQGCAVLGGDRVLDGVWTVLGVPSPGEMGALPSPAQLMPSPHGRRIGPRQRSPCDLHCHLLSLIRRQGQSKSTSPVDGPHRVSCAPHLSCAQVPNVGGQGGRWLWAQVSVCPLCSSSAESLDRLLPPVGAGRSPRKRTTSQCKSEPPLLRTSKRTIYTAGRPPWYNEHGTQSKEAFAIGECSRHRRRAGAAICPDPRRDSPAGPTWRPEPTGL